MNTFGTLSSESEPFKKLFTAHNLMLVSTRDYFKYIIINVFMMKCYIKVILRDSWYPC
jgi:hypothetical protein